MKKLLMLGLSFMLLVSFSVFAKEGDAIVGKWGLISMEEAGVTLEVDKLGELFGEETGEFMKSIFDESFIVVDKDDKVVFQFMGDKEFKGTVSEKDGKYSFEFIDEDSQEKMEVTGAIDKDKLTLENEELGKMVFKKE